MSQQRSENTISDIFESVKDLGTLYVENAKLTLAEKTTLLLSVIAIALVCLVLAMAVLVFLVIGIADLLATEIAPFWSYLIMAGIFLLCIALLIVFRVQLVLNPVARFVSRLFLNPPKK